MTEVLRGMEVIAPLYKLDESLACENAERFLYAMQQFFSGRNLLTCYMDRDLLFATDILLR